jgi:cyanate permease
MQGILSKTEPADRAGVLSTIYIISYSGAAIPNLIVGRVSGHFNLFQIAIGYVILVTIACIITFVKSRRDSY